MAEELNNEQETLSPEEMLAKLMRESVSKEKYDALQKQYNDFFAKVANGQFTNEEAAKEPTEEEKQQDFYRAIDDLNHHKCRGSVANMKALLTIDDYLVAHGERSAFAPSRGDITPEIDQNCRNLNALMREAVEQSDNDDTLCSAFFAKFVDTPFKVGER